MRSKSTSLLVPCLVCGSLFPTNRYRMDTGHGRFCSRACYLNRSDATAPERFWAKVNKHGPIIRPELGPCWVWTGTTDDEGYGRFEPRPRQPIRAHRYVFTLEGVPLSDNELSCHHCDNPPCIRFVHLFRGTNADNQQDMASKGRSALGDRNGHAVHPESTLRGERHHQAKLTASDVVVIRQRRAARERVAILAIHFGVSQALISYVTAGNGWSHIKQPPEHTPTKLQQQPLSLDRPE